jgi:hypothetical protein
MSRWQCIQISLTLAALSLRAADITGQVSDSQTGQGIVRARVTLKFGFLYRTGLVALTDDEGKFVFRSVPKGSYWLVASKNAYIENTATARATVNIGNEENTQPQTLLLVRQAVLKGRLIYESGHPMGGSVALIRKSEGNVLPKTQSQSSNVNHEGEFRFAGIEAGRYYLSATGIQEPFSKEVYPAVFYPDKTTLELATPFDLQPGQEIEVNFRRQHSAGYEVSGKVRCPIIPSLERAASPLLTTTLTPSWDETTKTFKFSGVPPGNYALWLVGAPFQTRRRSMPVVIIDADVTGIDIPCDFEQAPKND